MLHFFRRFNISTDFLHFEHLQVVSDTAERGIKLIEDYNKSTTKDEEQKQYVLLVIAECQKLLPYTLTFTLLKLLTFFILMIVNQFGKVTLITIASL